MVGAVLLGRREVDDGCAAEWESEGNTARRERVGRLGRRQVDDLVEEGCSAGREVEDFLVIQLEIQLERESVCWIGTRWHCWTGDSWMSARGQQAN